MSQFWKSLRNSFFAGLLIVLPVGASRGLLWWVVTLVTAWLPEQFSAPQHRLLAVVVLVVLTVGVGWLARRVAGKRLIDVAEMLIRQMPLLNRIYPLMKEISDTVLSGNKTMFQRVVLVEFPRPFGVKRLIGREGYRIRSGLLPGDLRNQRSNPHRHSSTCWLPQRCL